MNEAIYEKVKVNRQVVKLVRELVKDGYFRQSAGAKEVELRELNETLSEIYNIDTPTLYFDERFPSPFYLMGANRIGLKNYSIVSYLHEFRHALQHFVGVQYTGLTKEEDSRAYSMRVYASACPRMFVKAVKEGKILFVKWDEELGKVVDDV